MKEPRKVWHIFAKHYTLFRGTPTRMWLDYAFQELFGLEARLSDETADLYYDNISEKLTASRAPSGQNVASGAIIASAPGTRRLLNNFAAPPASRTPRRVKSLSTFVFLRYSWD